MTLWQRIVAYSDRLRAEYRRREILRVLDDNGWKINGAAKLLGMDTGNLRREMGKLGIKRPKENNE